MMTMHALLTERGACWQNALRSARCPHVVVACLYAVQYHNCMVIEQHLIGVDHQKLHEHNVHKAVS